MQRFTCRQRYTAVFPLQPRKWLHCERLCWVQHDTSVGQGASTAGCHLAFASYGDLSSLTWVENKPTPDNLEQCDVSYGEGTPGHQQLIQQIVQAVNVAGHLGFYMLVVLSQLLFAGALNFRDVMLAYGKLSRDLMAHGNGGDYIGLEFSGHVSMRNRNLQFLKHLSYCTALYYALDLLRAVLVHGMSLDAAEPVVTE